MSIPRYNPTRMPTPEERQPTPPDSPTQPNNQLDLASLTRALSRAEEVIVDVAAGFGYRFRLGEPESTTTLDLFPESSTARITTADTQVSLYRLPAPSVDTDRIIFERNQPRESHGSPSRTEARSHSSLVRANPTSRSGHSALRSSRRLTCTRRVGSSERTNAHARLPGRTSSRAQCAARLHRRSRACSAAVGGSRGECRRAAAPHYEWGVPSRLPLPTTSF